MKIDKFDRDIIGIVGGVVICSVGLFFDELEISILGVFLAGGAAGVKLRNRGD